MLNRHCVPLVGLAAAALAAPALAQKAGGTLRVEHMDNPPSASIHEEVTVSTAVPFMAVYNNLVLYKQDVPQNSLDTIEPELAESWTWSEDGTKLAFKLRAGVKWHDGKPFTSADVKCTWDVLAGKVEDKLRRNPRESWYANVDQITTEGERDVTFHLKRPQPSLLALLASGYSPVYPCHVPTATMRTKPIGTGPFKVQEFRQNDGAILVKNTEYWKPGRPYLDRIEFKIIPNQATRVLAFVAGEFDMTFPSDITPQLMKDILAQAPQSQCTMRPTNVNTNIIMNRKRPPFDNPDLRRAVALSLDRKVFVDILSEGKGGVGGAMLPPPEGVWGLPKEMLAGIPGYGDVAKNREEARALMRKLGYGPENRLAMKVGARNIPSWRNPAVLLTDQLKEIYIDAELEMIETTVYYNRMSRLDFTVGLNLTGNAVDDPDQNFYENYSCASYRNYTYCNPEVDKMIDAQSSERDPAKRKQLVWEVDRKLQEDAARPIIQHGWAAGCWQPQVKGLKLMVNSIYNNWRFEDIWLDR